MCNEIENSTKKIRRSKKKRKNDLSSHKKYDQSTTKNTTYDIKRSDNENKDSKTSYKIKNDEQEITNNIKEKKITNSIKDNNRSQDIVEKKHERNKGQSNNENINQEHDKKINDVLNNQNENSVNNQTQETKEDDIANKSSNVPSNYRFLLQNKIKDSFSDDTIQTISYSSTTSSGDSSASFDSSSYDESCNLNLSIKPSSTGLPKTKRINFSTSQQIEIQKAESLPSGIQLSNSTTQIPTHAYNTIHVKRLTDFLSQLLNGIFQNPNFFLDNQRSDESKNSTDDSDFSFVRSSTDLEYHSYDYSEYYVSTD